MILLVSTTIRHVLPEEPSGAIYTIDFERQQVRRRSRIIEPLYRDVDTNPRGGMRGSKGIAIRDDQVVITNSSMLFRYDPDWQLLGTITHPSCAGIHDILFQGDSIWVTSACADLALRFDFEGNLLDHIYFRQPASLRQELNWGPPIRLRPEEIHAGKIDFRDPRTHQQETFDHTHVNSVCRLPDGDLLFSLGLILESRFLNLLRVKKWLIGRGVWDNLLKWNRGIRAVFHLKKNIHSDLVLQPARGRSAVVRVSRTGDFSVCLLLGDKIVPSHSLLALPDGMVIYLDTHQGAVIHFDPGSGMILSSTKVTDGFLRGVARLPDGTLVMGSKGELIHFDLSTCQVRSRLKFSDHPQESVFDIAILPSHFGWPPLSFPDHFEVAMPAQTIQSGVK